MMGEGTDQKGPRVMTDETERERTTADSGVPRSARMERAAATFDGLDPDVLVALARQKNGLDLAERMTRTEKQHRDELIVEDRKSTRLNSSHVAISYAVFCL